MNVLLIDDHPLILSALQMVVRALADEVEVTSVGTAQAAREALSTGPEFDLALLDLRIGNDNGFELLSELRAACAPRAEQRGCSTPTGAPVRPCTRSPRASAPTPR